MKKSNSGKFKQESMLYNGNTSVRSYEISCGIHSKMPCVFGFLLIMLLLLTSHTIVYGIIVSIDPRATFLRTSDDDAHNSVPISLVSLGVSEGDYLTVKRVGDYSAYGNAESDVDTRMIAIFSSSATLKPSYELHRVPDAIDAGADRQTDPTFYNNLSTNIPEDFSVSYPTIVTVPQNARFIFVAAVDVYYEDNSDPDGDYGVEIILGYRWTNDGEDSDWDNPDNWNNPEYPSTNDAITFFDLPDTYAVTDYNNTIQSMNILNGEVNFDSGTGLNLVAPSNSLVINGGKLFWRNGELQTQKTVIGNNLEGFMTIETGGELYSVSEIMIGSRAKGELKIVKGIVETPRIIVGSENEGHLTLFNDGADLAVHDMHLGWGIGGRGWASVGSNAMMTVTNLISIGTIGSGILTVENGGYASANNLLVGGINFSLLLVESGGEIKVTRNITIRTSGSVINSGDLQAAQINVEAGGFLSSNGTHIANVVVADQGAVVVGLSPGTLTIDGNYLQQSGGILEIEIGGVTSNSEHDLLHITGNATLGGTLKLFFADGFAPQGGNPSTEDDTFDFIAVDGTINGSFSEVIVQGLEEGFQYDISPEEGSVKLTALSNGVPACIDEDEDGYPRYAISSCPNSNDADCNDTNPEVNPGAEEIPNAIDDDCDGNIDGFGDTTTIPEECPPDYTDCGNGYCCPPETPVCGEGEDEGLCFEKSGCPVTEIYGEHSEEAEFLRSIRDNLLDSTASGQGLIKLYYQWSPLIVYAMEADEEFKQKVKDMIDEVIPMLSY